MASTALIHDRADRWSSKNLEKFRANKRRRSDATISKHLAIMEHLASENGGKVPPYKWLDENGYFASYQVMKDYPAAFAHLEQATLYPTFTTHERQGEIAKAAMTVLAPIKTTRTLAEYEVRGALFNPTELKLQPGLTEQEWMQIGRALTHVAESAKWWIGDFVQYGFRQYGKSATFDLAQQSTGVSRQYLYAAAFVAKRFAPARRVAALSFYHHALLAKFKPEMSDRLLAEAVELGLTARQVRTLAEEETGTKKDKQEYGKVRICFQPETYQKLLRLAGGKPLDFFIAQLVVDFIFQQEGKQQ